MRMECSRRHAVTSPVQKAVCSATGDAHVSFWRPYGAMLLVFAFLLLTASAQSPRPVMPSAYTITSQDWNGVQSTLATDLTAGSQLVTTRTFSLGITSLLSVGCTGATSTNCSTMEFAAETQGCLVKCMDSNVGRGNEGGVSRLSRSPVCCSPPSAQPCEVFAAPRLRASSAAACTLYVPASLPPPVQL